MTDQRKALLLIGSPKPGASASLTLGTALTDRLAARGLAVETIRVAKALRTGDGTQAMLEAMDAAEIVVLASPLYADSLPAPVLRAFERAAERRRAAGRAAASPTSAFDAPAPGETLPSSQRFVAIVNCGFPEPDQCATALEICRLFARDAGFVWAGGLPLGMGGSVAGAPLERGPHARAVIPAFDLAADALARGEHVPPEAVALMRRQAMPGWLYKAIANIGWRIQARGKTGGRSLRYRPYAA